MERQPLQELFAAIAAEGVEYVLVGGVDVSVATPATLWRMKRDTVRPVDAEDAARLQAAFDLGEEP